MSFTFQQFHIDDEGCAMKVGTDGVIVGALASLPSAAWSRVLDVGAGSGLIALMIAQRSPSATIEAVEIDSEAAKCAVRNVEASKWKDRVNVLCCDIEQIAAKEEYWQRYALIVSNPPFFNETLHSPDAGRALARHGGKLDAATLIRLAPRLLNHEGQLSLIAPYNRLEELLLEAELAQLHLSRQVDISPTPVKPSQRVLLEFSRIPKAVRHSRLAVASPQFKELTKDFYLKP